MSRWDPCAIAQAVRGGDRRALARAITLAESTRREHRSVVVELFELLSSTPGLAKRIAVSGVPGVGKSTFIDALGCHIVSRGHRLAVLTIDPSSSRSGGSILGDKTRMPNLSQCSAAYIRPSPTSGALGGVARYTRESILLCEAAGFDVVIVETVGVGQSETAVANMTDAFLLLLLPGGGDDLQGIKRGIMELADLVLVNKADGELEATAKRTASDYANAIRLLQPRSTRWTVPVDVCSALTGEGIDRVWSSLMSYFDVIGSNGELATRRGEQSIAWMWEDTVEGLKSRLKEGGVLGAELGALEAKVRSGELPPTVASELIVAGFMEQRGH